MGISVLVWPVSDAEIALYSSDPVKLAASTNHLSMFSKDPAVANGFAHLHAAKQMRPLLESYVQENLGVVRVGGGFEQYFAMSAARVRTLHESQEQDPCGLLIVKFPTMAINRVNITDVIKIAVESDKGIMFHPFEDW